MAKAASINLNEAFAPPPANAVNVPTVYGDFLPSLANSAGPGPSSVGAAATRLSGQVVAVSSAKDHASSNGSVNSKRQSGPVMSYSLHPPSAPLSDGLTGGQQNAKLPPLMHGFAAGTGTGTGPGRTGSWSLGAQPQLTEPLQPLTQHPSILPGPMPASHPYQPKRKPPSAFMRNNPMRQQLEGQQQSHRGASAGSNRAPGAYDNGYASYQGEGDPGSLMQLDMQYQQQFADDVVAAAEAAIVQGQQQMWEEQQGGGGPGGGYSAAAPWGVSSVSDLEALDSILDQLVVVDARMRKALLKGPLISFETVVPEHVMNAARQQQYQQQYPQQQRAEDEKDRTFLTSVRGVAEGGGEEEAEPVQADSVVPPPSPVAYDGGGATAAPSASNSRQGRVTDDSGEPRDSAMFPASIPNPGMHPTFTRAYLASKMAAKPQHLPPPPPATAEHLLRSRPPPFIAAPSYDQLCSQIRDVQRQYTCGTARPAQGGGSGAAAAVAASSGMVGGGAQGSTINQYIAGLDGPSLEEVVAHQELPISLERVRPTFVNMKQKGVRAASPRRRPGSPGRGRAGTGDGHVDEGGIVTGGRML